MEAKELRLGNYVLVDDIVEKGVDYRCLNLWDFATYLSSMPDLYQPIPLTEEWLLKFRCDEDKSIISYDLDLDIHVCLNQGQALTGILLDNIKYVHQLQNLYFALTGEELTVKE